MCDWLKMYDYGTEEEGVPAADSEGVHIPSTSIHEELQQLQDHINPLAESENFGVEL